MISETHSRISGCIRVMSALAILKMIWEWLFAVVVSDLLYQVVPSIEVLRIVVVSIRYIPDWKSCVATVTFSLSEASSPVT